MLPKLHRATFISTFLFYVVLVAYEYIPLISLPEKYIPPVKDYADTLKWGLSFGVLPLVVASISYILSSAFDLHNNVAKFIKLRSLWDKYLIIKPLCKIAGFNRDLNEEESHMVMSKLYYPEVKEIKDKHYIELFWNKVYNFWIFFEFSTIVVISTILITVSKFSHFFLVSGNLLKLWLFVSVSIFLTFLIFIVSVRQRTESQVNQIPEEKIIDFFNKNFND